MRRRGADRGPSRVLTQRDDRSFRSSVHIPLHTDPIQGSYNAVCAASGVEISHSTMRRVPTFGRIVHFGSAVQRNQPHSSQPQIQPRLATRESRTT